MPDEPAPRGLALRARGITAGYGDVTVLWDVTVSAPTDQLTVDGVLREHQSMTGHNAQTYCLVKSA